MLNEDILKYLDNLHSKIVRSSFAENVTENEIIALVECKGLMTPKKPIFYDTKFRQRGKLYGEFVTMEKAYNCPNCNLTVWKTDKNDCCHHCGQAISWEESED